MRISDWSSDVCSSDLPQDGGTKLYGVSGKVNTPGAWELPMGVTLRELIEEHGGGLKKGLRFRGALPGGASTDFLVEEHLDVPMDYGSVAVAGSRLGTGTVIVLAKGSEGGRGGKEGVGTCRYRGAPR